MDASIAAVQLKILQTLTEGSFAFVEEADGLISIQLESARVFIRVVLGQDRRHTIVRVWCRVLAEVPASPELFKHIALHADDYMFGNLSAREVNDTISVFFSYGLLGDTLVPEELLRAAGAVVTTANDLDDELKERFGGRRFHEDNK